MATNPLRYLRIPPHYVEKLDDLARRRHCGRRNIICALIDLAEKAAASLPL